MESWFVDPIFSIKKLGNVFELSEITENKKEKAELEKEMERTTPQSCEIDKLRMIHHKS